MTQAYKLLAAVSITLAAISCNRDDSTTPTPNPTNPSTGTDCRLGVLRNPSNASETITFTYDASKRIASIVTKDSNQTTTRTFTPITGGFTSRWSVGGVDYIKDTTLVNSDGLVTLYAFYELFDEKDSLRQAYEYTGDKVNKLTTTLTNSNGQLYSIVTTYEYNTDSNLSKETQSGGTPITYDYYTDKTVRVGDFTSYQNLLLTGAKIVANKHLVKSQTQGNLTTTYTYEFDGNDRITAFTVKRGVMPAVRSLVEQSCN